MRKIHCLNPISKLGTGLLTENYEMTDNLAEAEGILVRSAAMHDLELPKGLRAVARAGAGVNNIPLDKCAEAGIVVFNTPGAKRCQRAGVGWHAAGSQRRSRRHRLVQGAEGQ